MSPAGPLVVRAALAFRRTFTAVPIRANFPGSREEAALTPLKFLVFYGGVFVLGAITATACKPDYKTFAFRCSPRQPENCPDGRGDDFMCCSDDPAASGGKNPRYLLAQREVGGETGDPIFSGGRNAASTSGMCVRISEIPVTFAIGDPPATNCPIPCNPKWSGSRVNQVCGVGNVCCQTTELHPTDCVNDNGTWRPAVGSDNGVLTRWGDQETSQDTSSPGIGAGCTAFAGGDTTSPAYLDCVAQLSVANQRGFCLPGDVRCPLALPEYLDACECMNTPSNPNCASQG